MTSRVAWARVAGATFLLYFLVALPAMVLLNTATGGEDATEPLRSIAREGPAFSSAIVLSLFSCFTALVLGVALYALTRDEDEHLALLALACRLGEGVLNGVSVVFVAALAWLVSEAASGQGHVDVFEWLGEFSLELRLAAQTASATFFAVGSLLFAGLLLRGRLILAPLAWWGVFASVLLVVGLPLELADWATASVVLMLWIPMGLFEVVLGLWLLIRAVPAGAVHSR